MPKPSDKPDHRLHSLRDSQQDVAATRRLPDTPQTRSPAYRLAFNDMDFMTQDALRPVRLQLELLKPQMILDELGIDSTVVLFGGARIPDPENTAGVTSKALADLSQYYTEARHFARIVTKRSLLSGGREDVICTGGGPGVMEAGNRGAADVGGQSIGLNIVLPHEQAPNPYVTPELSFNFHYFAIRKMHFLMRAKAICIFPGGFGTLDEMFESLTLIQTGRMKPVPFLLFGRAFWERLIDWEMLAKVGTINRADLDLFQFVETAEEAIAAMDAWPAAKAR